jgi:hypothetical protein
VKSISSIIVLYFILITIAQIPIYGQDNVTFELIDNSTVGLVTGPNSEKWGQAISDLDYNGWLDIYTIRWRNHPDQFSYLHLNNEGTFTDFTAQTPIKNIEQDIIHVRSVTIVDYDNDGDRDIFFSSEERMFLLQNENMEFTEIAESVGLIGQIPEGFITRWDYNTGAWADFDLDGDLDLVIHQMNYTNLYLYRNENGIFTDVATEYNLDNVDPIITNWDGGTSYSRLHWIDYDMDGDPDLSSGPLLFRNDGNTFTEVSGSLGLMPSMPIHNSEWFDYDNDGDLDFLKTCNYPDDPGCETQLWENEEGTFVDVTYDVLNLSSLLNLSRGISLGDFDNDGDLDLWICFSQTGILDALLINEEIEPGVRILEDVAQFVGLHIVWIDDGLITDPKGGTLFDYDNDGFLDIYIPETSENHLLWHNMGNANNWVGFILEGTESNSEAIGAVVRLYADGKTQLRYRKCPDGWLRQDMPWIHFGLGQTTNIDSVVIKWPLGLTEVLTDVEINQYHKIREGETTSQVLSTSVTTPAAFRLKQNYPNPFNPHTNIQYTMSNPGNANFIISNVLGKEIKTFNKLHHSSGTYNLLWDGRNKSGKNVPAGIYLCRFKTMDFRAMIKMLLIR